MSEVYTISGGPGCGKTDTVSILGIKYLALPEAARLLGDTDSRFKGKSIKEIDKKKFQEAIFSTQKRQLENVGEDITFSDRGLGDTIAYFSLLGSEIPREIMSFAKDFRYARVFILDPLPPHLYKKDELRQESYEEAEGIHEEIIKMYKELDYDPVFIPFMSRQGRVSFIKEKLL
jgi:predicted ATPase